MDLTGTPTYLGSPSAHEQIAADLELEPHRFDLTLRKEILWESETATDAEVRAMEIKLIVGAPRKRSHCRLQPNTALAGLGVLLAPYALCP